MLSWLGLEAGEVKMENRGTKIKVRIFLFQGKFLCKQNNRFLSELSVFEWFLLESFERENTATLPFNWINLCFCRPSNLNFHNFVVEFFSAFSKRCSRSLFNSGFFEIEWGNQRKMSFLWKFFTETTRSQTNHKNSLSQFSSFCSKIEFIINPLVPNSPSKYRNHNMKLISHVSKRQSFHLIQIQMKLPELLKRRKTKKFLVWW